MHGLRGPADPRPRPDGLDLDAGRATAAGGGARRRDGPARSRPVRRADGGLRRRTSSPRTRSPSPRAPASLDAETDRVTLVGHGFGAIVAAWTAARLGERCGGLVLVDGGWEDVARTSGLEPDEFLRGLDEPPEVLRSHGRVSRRPARLRSGDLGRRRGAGGPGHGRGSAVETGDAGNAAARGRRHRQRDVRVRAIADPALGEAPIAGARGRRRRRGDERSAALAEAQAALAAAGRPPIRVARLRGTSATT